MDLNTHTHIFMDRGSRYSCSTALGPSHQWPQIIRPFRWPGNKYMIMISGSLHGQRQFKHSSQSPSTARSQLCCNSFRDSGKDQDCKICSKTIKDERKGFGHLWIRDTSLRGENCKNPTWLLRHALKLNHDRRVSVSPAWQKAERAQHHEQMGGRLQWNMTNIP